MKLTSLAVITLLVLGCSSAFAASGSFSLGFLSYTGGLQYCDYEVMFFNDPFIAGIHNYTGVCGFEVDGAMAGLANIIPRTTGLPVTRAVYTVADNSFDAETLAYTGCQIDWVTRNHASKLLYGWEFVFTCGGGGDYLGNYGYLTTTLGAPTHNGPAKASTGKIVGTAFVKK